MALFIEIMTAIAAVSVVVLVIGRYIYKEHKGLNHHGCDGSCSYVVKRGLKNIRKELEKERTCNN